MNKFLLFTLLLVGSVGAIAQNKTLGVGVITPNPNAVLHVEAPNNNQGLLMPRMTTAQRTAPSFTSALSATDIGLMVFDTDMMGVYVWEGAQWGDETISATTTASSGNAGYFAINNPANMGAALYATTNGAGGATSAAIVAETATAFSAITARGNGGAANALTGIISDPGPGGYAVLGTVSATGGGQAGVFNIANPSNPNNTLEVTTSGTGGAAKFKVANVGSLWPAVWAETNSNQPLSTPIYGLNTGTGDAAGVFRINNAGSNKHALFAETNGSGSVVQGLNLGTGNGGYFRKNGSNSGSSAVWGDNFGDDGYGGIFQNISTTNPKPALFAESVGPGSSIWALKSAGDVSGDALLAENGIPTGSAGKFVITDATNPNPTIIANTNSTANGAAILATNTGVGDAVFANANSGSGGNFQNTNASNNASVVFATTNAQSGHSIGTMNTANGSAFSIFQGGMKISTFEVTTGTTIATRAAAYRITGGGPAYTISFPTATGDMYMVYNDTGAGITFEGVAIPSGTGKIVINFNSGSFRGL